MSSMGAEGIDVLEDIEELTRPLVGHLLTEVKTLGRDQIAALHADRDAGLKQNRDAFAARITQASDLLRSRVAALGFGTGGIEVRRLATIAGLAHAARLVDSVDPRRRLEIAWAELLIAGYSRWALVSPIGLGASARARALATIALHQARDQPRVDVLADIAALEHALCSRILARVQAAGHSYGGGIRQDGDGASRGPNGRRFRAAVSEAAHALGTRLSAFGIAPDSPEAQTLALVAGHAHAARFVQRMGRRQRMIREWARLLAAEYPGWTPSTRAERECRVRARAILAAVRAARASRRRARASE